MMIVVLNPKSDDPKIFGPFESGEEATYWADAKFGICGDWFWCDLIDPKSPYAMGLPNYKRS